MLLQVQTEEKENEIHLYKNIHRSNLYIYSYPSKHVQKIPHSSWEII